MPASVADQIQQFAQLYAPDVAVGVIDGEGFRSFAGPGLELDARPRRSAIERVLPPHLPDLFSDLNQWMLKVLLGQQIPEALISVPREPIRHASQLAAAAGVSVMSASRLVHQLGNEGFLGEGSISDRSRLLQIVRTDELLQRWVSARARTSRDIPARWILRKDVSQFSAAVARYAAESRMELRPGAVLKNRRVAKPPDRMCVGLFAAADALGFGFVHGVPPHLYMERLDHNILQKLGLAVAEDSGRLPDAYIRIPANKEAIFRPVVLRDNLPVSDALQVWLDVSTHPARGREQANEIRRRILKPLFGKNA